jgi:tetratricopeptide (TPR) repeat protein
MAGGLVVIGVCAITLAPAPVRAAANVTSDLADFIVKPAEDALRDRKLGLAISLWRGVVAIRGDADAAVEKLALAWTLAGEPEAAVEELERRRRATTDAEIQGAIGDEIIELEQRARGFTGQVFQVVPAPDQAREAFRRGRRAFETRRYADAAAYYRAGIEMAPDLPGNYRELGEALAKVGRTDEATTFFGRYLRLRPFGKNADEVRARLAASGATGKLSVGSSFACEQVWINRQPVPRPASMTRPIVNLVVAAGHYRLLCYSEKYHFARYLNVDVAKAGNVRADFTWAIIENRLDPWGRIVMENPDRQSEMNDIGVWNEIGVPVPDDQRPLKVLLRAGDNSRRKEVTIQLEAGKRIPLAW